MKPKFNFHVLWFTGKDSEGRNMSTGTNIYAEDIDKASYKFQRMYPEVDKNSIIYIINTEYLS